MQVKCLCFHLFCLSNCCCWPANILSHISSNFALQFGPDFCGSAILKYYFSFVTFCFKNLGQVDLRYWVTMIWKWSHILLHFAATQHCNKVAYIFHWRKFDIFTLFKILAKIIRKRHKEHLISIFTINVRLEDMPMKYTSDRERLVSKQYSIYNEISRFYILVTLSSSAFNPLLQLPSWTLGSKGINLIWKRYLFHESDIL